MPTELICPTHGPYDASYGSCPYCSGQAERPAAPTPLDEDDLPTDIGAGGGVGNSWNDDDSATDIGRGSGSDTDLPTDFGIQGHSPDETELDFTDDSAQALLWVKDGRRRGRVHMIKDGYKVGRADADIVLDDPKISTLHARFRFEDEKFTLWDFGSKNGSHVNGTKIKAATDLKENDEIRFGDTTFVLKVLD